MQDFVSVFLDIIISFILSAKRENLILSDCNVHLINKTPYSEIDELNFCPLNSNNGFGNVSFELVFEKLNVSYSIFYLGCLSLRTDNGFIRKLNRPDSFKEFVSKNCTKLNKNGKVVLGVEYFFQSEKEYQAFLTCSSISFDGFLALRNKYNTYGFVCRLYRKGNDFNFVEGNTSRIYKFTNIRNLWH